MYAYICVAMSSIATSIGDSALQHYSARAALATGLATSNVRMLVNSLNSLNFHLLYKSSCFIEHMLKIIISTICSKGRRNKKKIKRRLK